MIQAWILLISWALMTFFSILFIIVARDTPGKEADEAEFMLIILSFIPLFPLLIATFSFIYFWDTKIKGNKYERQTKLSEVRE